MQVSLYQTADAGVSPSDSGRRSLSIRQRRKQKHIIIQRMQETHYQTADAGDSIRQRMKKTLYQTADAGVSRPDSGYRSISIR